MAIFRIVAWVLVAVALMLLGADAISTLEQGEPVVRTTAEILGLLGLQIDPADAGVVKFLLEAPLWMFLGILGIILTLIFRPID